MKNNSDISTFIKEQPKGSHLSCLYSSIEDLHPVIIPFLIDGFEKNQQSFYIHNQNFQKNLKETLFKNGIDYEEKFKTKQLIFQTTQNIYHSDENFIEEKVVSQIKPLLENAQNQGFGGVRFVADSSWLSGRDTDIKSFMKYESKINQIFEDLGITALCLYNPKFFKNQNIVDIIRTHKHIFYKGKIIESKYFEPSENFVPVTGSDAQYTESIINSTLYQ